TEWVDRRQRAATAEADRDASDALVAASILAYQRRRRDARANFFSDTTRISPSRVPPSAGQEVHLSLAGTAYRLHVFALGSWRYRVELDGRTVTVTLRERDEHLARLELRGRARRVICDATEVGLRVELDGRPYRFGWETTGQVRAAAPALVVAVQVSAGDRVAAGDLLGFLEAMKVEIGFSAPIGGVVRESGAAKGPLVAAGDVLVVIEPEAEGRQVGAPGSRLTLDGEADPLDVRAEIRGILLGYDVDPERVHRLVALLESADPQMLPEARTTELAALAHEVVVFADLEQLFLTEPRAAGSGHVGPSNAALVRGYVRRMRAGGAGIAEDVLALLRAALGHYGIGKLAHGDALERALLRLFATQNAGDLRRHLVRPVLRSLAACARAGAPLA